MNHQEAITIIEANRPRSGYPKLHTACGVAIKALESMPEYEKLKERDAAKPAEKQKLIEGGRLYIGECPSCGLAITTANFCGNCGQRVDWSEEES